MPQGSYIHTHMPDEDANGTLICTMTTWDGKLYRIPRSKLDDYKNDTLLKQCGIYFLFGVSNGYKAAYIGQGIVRSNGKGVLSRVVEHRKPEESFWDVAVIVVSKTNELGPTETYYLEHECYCRAKNAGRYKLTNANVPSEGNYNDMIQAVMGAFLSGMESVMSLLGYKVFTPPPAQVTLQTPDLFIKRSNDPTRLVDASIVRHGNKYVLLKGSLIALKPTNSCPNGIKKKRQQLSDLVDATGRTNEDIEFDSVSGLSKFALFASSDGYRDIQDASRRKLKDILADT